MSLRHLARQAMSMPPHIALAKTLKYGGRILLSHICQLKQRWKSSFQPVRATPLNTVLRDMNSVGLTNELKNVTSLVSKHRFDLLGSGWLNLNQILCANVLSPGNRKRSAAIRELIDQEYTPIDWQLDFKSGYCWRENRMSGTLRYGHERGVDVKVPWELARLQHLPLLALSGGESVAREFRNQVLDFAAANPPGYGVNWMCTMDVAIRAANILFAYDIFVRQGTQFDEAFLGELNALIMAHGKHIASHLEWHDLHRANHYLADIAGLLFVAAYLPRSDDTDTWLAFSIQQLIKEVARQFMPDGTNFEASTSYHRLSSEMVIYATALVLGLPEDKKEALREYQHFHWRSHPPLTPAPIESFPIPGYNDHSPFPGWYFERLERMAEFTIHVTKQNGCIAQIGDNDSGRFFKLCPSIIEVDGEPQEQHLDHRATVAAINGLFGRSDFAEFAGDEFATETSIVSALSKICAVESYLKKGENPRAEGRTIKFNTNNSENLGIIAETIIEVPEADVLNNLTSVAYPDFGLYIWRSPRLFLSLRCGPVGQNGNGGHAHNDQLAIELNIDGEDWIADPGTYLYTPSPEDRNAYRSVHAHAAPKIGEKEPSRLDFGLFRLEDNVNARCLKFNLESFEGVHTGYGDPLYRRIDVEAGQIRIRDMSSRAEQVEVTPVSVKDAKELRRLWALTLPFSPGYGIREEF